MARSQIVLEGVSPKLHGLRWQAAERLRIGRSANSADVVLEDPTVSPQHAEVVATNSGWVVRDLGSKHGTGVNGIRLGRAEHPLRRDDTLQCGNLVLQVALLEMASPDEPTPTPVPTRNIIIVPTEPSIRTSGTFLTIRTSVQHSWEEALETVAAAGEPDSRQGKHLLTLLRTGHHLTHLGSLDQLLQSILDDTVAALDAQRGSIVLADETTGSLELRAVSMRKPLQQNGRYYSRTLAERSFQMGESLLCSDVSADARLQEAGSIVLGTMSSIVCALLRSPRQRLGVLHLDRGPFQEPFSREEFYLADAIAASVSIGIESALLVLEQACPPPLGGRQA